MRIATSCISVLFCVSLMIACGGSKKASSNSQKNDVNTTSDTTQAEDTSQVTDGSAQPDGSGHNDSSVNDVSDQKPTATGQARFQITGGSRRAVGPINKLELRSNIIFGASLKPAFSADKKIELIGSIIVQ